MEVSHRGRLYYNRYIDYGNMKRTSMTVRNTVTLVLRFILGKRKNGVFYNFLCRLRAASGLL